MATQLKRLEFKQRYSGYLQGLFILPSEKRFPKDQAEVNVGQQLSLALCDVPEGERADRAAGTLADTLGGHSAVTLTHPEILFTPSLKLDVVRMLQIGRAHV